MDIFVLGTSSGTPTTTRNVSGLALRMEGARGWYLVDCGEGTQHRILHTPLSLMQLRAIFITHVHGDHCYGLPGLLASAGMLNRTAALTIVGPAPVERFVCGVMDATELCLPYPIVFQHVERAPSLHLGEVDVQATALSHRVPSYAFSFTETAVARRLDPARLTSAGVPDGPLRGQLQRGQDITLDDGRVVRAADVLLPPRKPRKLIVGGDNDTPELLAHAARGADVLIHEATYTQAQLEKIGPEPQHSSALKVARFAQAAQLPHLILTHFSPRYQDAGSPGLSLSDLEAEARSAYDGQLHLAHDFDQFHLDKQGQLRVRSPNAPFMSF